MDGDYVVLSDQFLCPACNGEGGRLVNDTIPDIAPRFRPPYAYKIDEFGGVVCAACLGTGMPNDRVPGKSLTPEQVDAEIEAKFSGKFISILLFDAWKKRCMSNTDFCKQLREMLRVIEPYT